MKFILKTLGFTFLLLFLVLVVLLLIPDQYYKQLAEKAIQKVTNRQAAITELITERGLNPSINLKGFTLANPDWAQKPEMLSADEFKASIDLVELIKGRLNIDLASDALNVDLIRDKEGKTNWAFASEDASPVKQQSKNPSIQTLARFVLKHLNMKNFKLVFDDQQANRKHELIIEEMDAVESENGITQKFDAKGSLDKLALSLTGSTGTFTELKNSRKLPLDLKASLDDLVLSIKGSVDAESDEFNLNSDLDLSMPTFAVIHKFVNQEFPQDWKNITASGRLYSKAGQFMLQDADIKMDGGLKVDVTGSISDLNQLRGVDLDLNASLVSINSLSVFAPDPLPDLGPFKFNGTVASDQNKLTLKSSNLSYSGEYGKAEIKGDIGNLLDVDQVNLKADIELPNLNIAKLFTDTELPALGQIRLTSDLVSNAAKDLSADNIELHYDHQGLKLNADGSINSIIKNGGELDLGVKAAVNSLTALNELAKSKLPELGPIDLSTRITGKFSEIRVNQINAELNDKVLTGNLTGDIGSISNFDQIKVNADLNSPSIGNLLSRFGMQSTATTPAHLTANILQQGEGINLETFKLQLDDNKIHGNVDIQGILAESKRPKLSGNIEVTKFNLNDLLGAPTETSSEPTDKPAAKIPDSPLPFHLIRENDLDLELDIKQFDSSFISLKDTNVRIITEQDKLKLGPFNSNLNGGDTSFEATIDASSSPADLSIKTTINGFSFKQAGTFEDSTLLENEGTANASLDVVGSGESIAAILGTANGGGYIDIKNLTIKNDLIKFVSGDLVKEAATKLNPLQENQDTTKILCSAVKIDITDGLLKTPNGYIADAEAFTITGESEVNFKNQGLDIEVNTNPKEGLGLGLGELARAIKITGTIPEPKIGISAQGVAEIGATVGAAIATGGVSLLAQGQLEKVKARSESCAKILE